MTEESPHIGPVGTDSADRGGTIGAGLVPDEATEGEAQERAHNAAQAVGAQPDQGLVRPGGVDTGELTEDA